MIKFLAKCASFLCVSLSCFAVPAKFCSALFKDKSLNKMCVFSLCFTLTFAVPAKFCSALFKDKSLNKLCVFSLCFTLLLDYGWY